MLDGLATLVHKSLLQRFDGPDGAPRVAMLETIRQFALEQLTARTEEAAARQRHARYYLAQVEATGGCSSPDRSWPPVARPSNITSRLR